MVREGAEQAVQRSIPTLSRLLPNQSELSESRKFKLQFKRKLLGRLYTGNRVEAEGPSPVQVELLDALSGNIVEDDPLSSLKVEILVLQGHFKAEQSEDWTHTEFSANIVSARVGKRPLLVGKGEIALCNGVGVINDIYFTDNSSWVRSKMFRLGARVVLAKENQVREAVSSPFRVKDQRGEGQQKHDNPSPEDEVWRLHGISKTGKTCKRLAEHQIHKVEDLVRLYHNDEDMLRRILDGSPKKLKTIVQAASSLSNIIYTKPSDLAPNYVPKPICPTAISSLNQQHLCAPAPSKDQPEMPVSYNHGTSHSNQFYESSMSIGQDPGETPSMLFDDGSLMANLLATSSSEEGNYSLNCSMTTTGLLQEQGFFDVPALNLISIARTMWEEGNDSFGSCSSNSPIGQLQLPLIPNTADSSTTNIAKPKGG